MIKDFILPLPDLVFQEKFAQIVLQIEKQKQLTQQSLQKSEELFQSLLQKAFRGELVKYDLIKEQLSEAAENDILYNTK